MQHTPRFAKKKLIVRAVLLAFVAGTVYAAYSYVRGLSPEAQGAATFTAFRGPMEIAVVEGGSIEARDATQIQSEVQGVTKILSLVEEGYLITPEDVGNGLVLIELDSKELVDRQLSQELEYQNSVAALTEAIEQYEIQLNQNESDIKGAELESLFARMDLEKYLGGDLAVSILRELGLDDTAKENEAPRSNMDMLDLAQYAHPEKLGDGEARQRLRRLEDELALAAEEVGLSETKLEGAKRLFDREFVTKTQLDNDQMAYNRKVIARQSAETSLDLFIKYEFPKESRKLLSDYEESLRKLERVRKLALSKTAQSEAKKNSAEVRHELQTRKRKELADQIEKCIIRAPRTGLVVYGTGEQNWRGETIEEGANVRERQVLLTIPDTTDMSVRVQVHESFVKKVRSGQFVRIRVDAFPNEQLTGVVHRIAVLPDSQNRWMSPELKVYSTTIHIDGERDWLKPGMSAEAEIVIEIIEDAVQVPVHAVHLINGETVCYVAGLFGTERRLVKTGEYNISFMQILDGLETGESVLLRAPDARGGGEDESQGTDGDASANESDETPVEPAAPPERPQRGEGRRPG